MHDKWYGDNRDLVKWGTLLELAHRYGARHILQVLYKRKTEWGQLEIDGQIVELPDAVIRHFRNSAAIGTMRCECDIEIVPEINEGREDYHQVVLCKLQARKKFPGIVFLDPDTGLEPPSRPGLQHVRAADLEEIWRAMQPRDVLVLYQHQTNRNGRRWIKPKRTQFEHALKINQGSSKLARATKIASDVAFIFAQKNTQQ